MLPSIVVQALVVVVANQCLFLMFGDGSEEFHVRCLFCFVDIQVLAMLYSISYFDLEHKWVS